MENPRALVCCFNTVPFFMPLCAVLNVCGCVRVMQSIKTFVHVFSLSFNLL